MWPRGLGVRDRTALFEFEISLHYAVEERLTAVKRTFSRLLWDSINPTISPTLRYGMFPLRSRNLKDFNFLYPSSSSGKKKTFNFFPPRTFLFFSASF